MPPSTCGVKKFVFSSTCATYGPPDRVPMTEDLPQRPINPYGESKLMFEKMLLWYRQIHGLEFVAFRYFNAAGASEKFGEHHRIETHLIPNVLKVALGQAAQCEIYGTDYPTPDGTCIRDYIHILDLAQAHILGLAPGKTGFYNLGNGDGYSVRRGHRDVRKESRAKKFPPWKSRAAPATRPNWWPRPTRRFANWAGNHNSPSLTTSSPRRGRGINSIQTAIRTECRERGSADWLKSSQSKRLKSCPVLFKVKP